MRDGNVLALGSSLLITRGGRRRVGVEWRGGEGRGKSR